MNNLRCLFGFHQKNLKMKQQTKEIDSVSGVFLKRNVYHCDRCNKYIYERTDGLIGIDDKKWTWFITDYYL